MNNHITNNIFCDLDVLLDTRLAMLSLLLNNNIDKLDIEKEYKQRKSKDIGIIPNNMFEPLYKKRNKFLLEMALPTHMLDLLVELYNESLIVSRMYTNEDNYLYINTYPYNLTTQEKNGILAILDDRLISLKVEFVYQPKIDLSWLDKNVSTIIKYDGLEELNNAITEQDKNILLLDKHLIVPAITVDNRQVLNKSDFLDIAKQYSTIIKILFVDVKYFCAKVKNKK